MRGAAASLGSRLLLGASVLIVLAMAVTGLVMAYALRNFIQGQVDGRLDGQIAAVMDALRTGPDGTWRLERIVDGPPFDRPGSNWSWTVVTPAGPVLRSRSLGAGNIVIGTPEEAARPGPPPPGTPPGAGPGFVPGRWPPPATAGGTGPDGETLRVRLRAFLLGPDTITVAAAAPLAALAGPLRAAMTPVLVALTILGALLIGGGFLQIALGLRPLRVLRADLAAVREGRAERIVGLRPVEVQPLVSDLNALLDQHAAHLERARRHVANLAHSLKTPLATLALALEEPTQASETRLKPLVATMDRMIRHHLARARTAALGGPTRARVDLAGRLSDHRAAFDRLYADKGLAIALAVTEGLAVACEAQDLDEVLGNLLDNACRFAGGRVAVVAVASGAAVDLTIADDGRGLPDDRMAEVLRPGRRVDESSPGYGFGLPIAAELVELYGGTLLLRRSASLGGLEVGITLPRAT